MTRSKHAKDDGDVFVSTRGSRLAFKALAVLAALLVANYVMSDPAGLVIPIMLTLFAVVVGFIAHFVERAMR
jgi:hypothetical protein